MAKTLNKTGIITGNTVEAYHVTQSIDAFTGIEAYDISLSGSLNITGSNITNGVLIVTGSNDVKVDIDSNILFYTEFGGTPIIELSDQVYVYGRLNATEPTNTIYGALIGTASTSSFITGSGVYGPFGSNSILSASYAQTFGGLTTTGGGGTISPSGPGPFGLSTQGTDPINLSINSSLRLQVDESGSVNLGDGGNGTLSNVLNASRTTPDASPTTLLGLTTAAGVAYTVQAYVVGYGGANGKIGGDIIGVFQNIGGTLTSAGSPISNIIEDFSGSPTFTLTTSGTDIILQVTGQAATTINWAGHLKFVSYDSTL